MHEKVNNWIDVIERVLNLIRPKAYNAIAKAVVFTGIGLLIESQVNFVHVLAVALFEEYIGKSEILRIVLNASNDPTIGFSLISVGMVYHIAMTLGKDYVETKKKAQPEYPSLRCDLLNGDKEKLDSNFFIRGKLVSLPSQDEIPSYKQASPDYNDPIFGDIYRMASLHSSLSGATKNKELFRERAKVLSKWAGAELLHMRVHNESSILASGVSIQLKIPRHKGLYLSMPGLIPDTPKEENDPLEYLITPRYHTPEALNPKALSFHSDSRHYHASWNVMRIQASTEELTVDGLLIKTDKPVEIECTIYCDELPEPIVTKYTANPPSEMVDISVAQLTQKELYDELCENLIMDGYESRVLQSMYEAYQMEETT